jgi:formate--tetrahydrofolate ligase
MTMPSALEISRQATLKPVTEIAAEAGLPPWLIEPYGEHVAKIDLKAMPGLTTHPAAEPIDIDAGGRVVGLS